MTSFWQIPALGSLLFLAVLSPTKKHSIYHMSALVLKFKFSKINSNKIRKNSKQILEEIEKLEKVYKVGSRDAIRI